jgi:hypothetical protein
VKSPNSLFRSFGRSPSARSSRFVGTRPTNSGGGGCSGGSPNIPNCSPNLDVLPERGLAPVVIPFCSDDVILDPGRTNDAYVTGEQIKAFFDRGAVSSPEVSLRTSGIIGSVVPGQLDLHITVPRPTGAVLTDPNYRGQLFFVPGFVVSVSTSNNNQPGDVTLNWGPTGNADPLAGVPNYFENWGQWTQSIVLQQGHIGMSRFAVLPSVVSSGMTFPELIRLQKDLLLSSPPGVAVLLSAGGAPNDATQFVPTNGLRAQDTFLSLNVQGFDGTGILVETLGPKSQLWDWTFAAVLNALAGGGS